MNKHLSKIGGLLALLVAFTIGQPAFAISQSGAEAIAPQVITDSMHCKTCGMFPARYPKWQTQIQFKDGNFSAFDGGKCMFRFIFMMAKFDQQHTAKDISAILVKDFNTGNWIDGTEATFVIGSKVMGPMGKELIPFSSSDAAKKFQAANGGTIAAYDAIEQSTIKPLMMMKKNKMGMGKHRM